MSRNVDVCTCGRDRADHGNATDHEFFPHPQPPRALDKTFDVKLAEWLATQGECRQSLVRPITHEDAAFVLKTAAGEIWEVQAFKRSYTGDGV